MTNAVKPSKKALVIGWILSALPVLMLTFSAAMKFVQPDFAKDGNSKLGWPDTVMIPLGIVELSCVILYLIPRTSVLGAILMTGYLGGATAAHVRVQEAFWLPVAFGVLAWLGLYLRDQRIRALIPLRSSPGQ